MTTKVALQLIASEFHPYPSRPAANIDKCLQKLASGPQIKLTPQEKERINTFERQLTRGENLGTENAKGVEYSWSLEVNKEDYYPEYFLTTEGKKDLSDTFGFPQDKLDFQDTHSFSAFLAGYDYSKFTQTASLAELAGRSLNYVHKRFVSQFAKESFSSVDKVDNPVRTTIVRNPTVLAIKIIEYHKLRRYHKLLAHKLISKHDSLSYAKKVVLNIHARRLGELIAETYQDAIALYQQETLASTPKTRTALTRITQEIPFLEVFINSKGLPNQRLMARINNFINGVGELTETGEYTALNEDIVRLAQEVSQPLPSPSNNKSTWLDEWGVSLRDVRDIIVSAQEWKSWAETVLENYGLLSKYDSSAYDPDREGKAPDGLWQVVITDKHKNLMVYVKQGVIFVPKEFDRPLADLNPSGAVPVLDHEITHVLQHENKSKLALTLTDNVGMDRATINLEAGAIIWESQAQEKIFGQTRPVSPHYLRAVQAKLNGGSYKECVAAFFDSYLQQNPGRDKYKAATLAANRAGRLFRNGGVHSSESAYLTNSQPLVYLEQELLARELTDAGLTDLVMIADANLKALSELNAIGLLSLDSIRIPEMRPSEIIKEKILDKIKQSCV